MNNQHSNEETNTQVNTDEYTQLSTDEAVAENNNLKSEELDGIDYILPVTEKKKRTRKKAAKKSAILRQDSETEDFVYAQPYNKKHKKKKKTVKVLGIILAVVAALLIICVSTLLIFNQVGKATMHDYNELNIEPPVEKIDNIESVEDSGKVIKYDGHTYVFNEKVTSVVFMGIDRHDNTENKGVGSAGQSDAIYIAVMDTLNKKVTILGVSRDSMTDVNVYNKDGDFVNTQFMQLCLSYAYGDGAHKSCENTITSLERLFYGMQFDTYFSMDEHALEILSDEIGGVTLTSQVEFHSNNTNQLVEVGDTVTLYGSDTTKYIKARDLEELESNNDRMARQKQFITAFLAQSFNSVKKKPSTVVDLYNTIDDYSTTNLNASKMTYLASTAISGLNSYKDVEFVNVPGTIKKGEYAEFHVDQEGMMDILLNLFYVKVI